MTTTHHYGAVTAQLPRALRTPLITEQRSGVFEVRPGTSTGERQVLAWAEHLAAIERDHHMVDERLRLALAATLNDLAAVCGGGTLWSAPDTAAELADVRDQLRAAQERVARAEQRTQDLEAKLLAMTEAPDSGTATSHDAAKTVVPVLTTQRRRVLAALLRGPTTAQGIERITGLAGNSVRPRLRELEALGWVERTGRVVRGELTGRRCNELRITAAGVAKLQTAEGLPR